MKKTMVAAINEKVGVTDAEVLARILDVNGEQSTMLGFLYTNLCDAATDHIAIGDAKEVIALNIEEAMYIGTSTITRLK